MMDEAYKRTEDETPEDGVHEDAADFSTLGIKDAQGVIDHIDEKRLQTWARELRDGSLSPYQELAVANFLEVLGEAVSTFEDRSAEESGNDDE